MNKHEDERKVSVECNNGSSDLCNNDAAPPRIHSSRLAADEELDEKDFDSTRCSGGDRRDVMKQIQSKTTPYSCSSSRSSITLDSALESSHCSSSSSLVHAMLQHQQHSHLLIPTLEQDFSETSADLHSSHNEERGTLTSNERFMPETKSRIHCGARESSSSPSSLPMKKPQRRSSTTGSQPAQIFSTCQPKLLPLRPPVRKPSEKSLSLRGRGSFPVDVSDFQPDVVPPLMPRRIASMRRAHQQRGMSEITDSNSQDRSDSHC
jgi:hypothetical protein